MDVREESAAWCKVSCDGVRGMSRASTMLTDCKYWGNTGGICKRCKYGQDDMDRFAEDFENTGEIFPFNKQDDFQTRTTPTSTAPEDVTTDPFDFVTRLDDDMEKVRKQLS